MDEEGFSGLEAGIILIAFVVVASVFSYSIINAGFFTAQTSESVIHNSLTQSSSGYGVIGDVHGMARGNGIGEVTFTVSLNPGSGPVSFDDMQLIWSTSDKLSGLEPSDPLISNTVGYGSWGIVNTRPATASSDTLLEIDETYTIKVNLTDGQELLPDEAFSLEMRSSSTPVININKHAPRKVDPVNILY